MSIGEPRHEPPAFIARSADAESRGASAAIRSTARHCRQLRAAIAALARRDASSCARLGRSRHDGAARSTARARPVRVRAGDGRCRSRAPLVVMPNPFYQIYEGAALLAGAQPHFLGNDVRTITCRISTTCRRESGTLPGAVPVLAGQSRPAPCARIDYLQRALALADRHDFVIAADECYSEIYFDEAQPPPRAAAGRRRERAHELRALRRIPQPVEAIERAGPALRLRRRRRAVDRRRSGCTARITAARCRCRRNLRASRLGATTRTSSRTAACIARSSLAVCRCCARCWKWTRRTASFYLWPKVPDDERFARRAVRTPARHGAAGQLHRARHADTAIRAADACASRWSQPSPSAPRPPHAFANSWE